MSSRDSQVAEGSGLQVRRRQPPLVRIQLPSPFPGSSVGSSAWLLTRRSEVRTLAGEPDNQPLV